MHPRDLAALTAAGRQAGDLVGVELVPDASLSPGDAVSTFEGGFFDARIETAFARAQAALLASPALMSTVAGGC